MIHAVKSFMKITKQASHNLFLSRDINIEFIRALVAEQVDNFSLNPDCSSLNIL
jgi:hypothetical protein